MKAPACDDAARCTSQHAVLLHSHTQWSARQGRADSADAHHRATTMAAANTAAAAAGAAADQQKLAAATGAGQKQQPHMQHQQQQMLQEQLAECRRTYKLNLGYGALPALPPGFAALVRAANPHLLELDLSSNNLADLPDNLADGLAALRALRLKYNALRRLPACACKFPALATLELAGNQIAQLDGAALARLAPTLRELDLSGNQLAELPAAGVGALVKLETLRLENNQLEALPEALGQLAALVRLSVANNRLRELPAALGRLKRLQRVDAANNLLARVPPALGHARALKELCLRANPLNERVRAKADEGLSRLLAFLRDEEARERAEEAERLRPVGTPSGPFLEYRCRAEAAATARTPFGDFPVDNRVWLRVGHTLTQVGGTAYVFGGQRLRDVAAAAAAGAGGASAAGGAGAAGGGSSGGGGGAAGGGNNGGGGGSKGGGGKGGGAAAAAAGTAAAAATNELFWLSTERMEWRAQPTCGDKPAPRYGHVAVHDPDHNQLVVYGGRNAERRRLGDVAVLDLDTLQWRRPPVSGAVPAPRDGAAAAYHAGSLWVFGGRTPSGRSNELLCLDLSTWAWSAPATAGAAPSPRGGAALTVAHGRHLVLHGGRANFVLNDAHVFDLLTRAWVEADCLASSSSSAAPPPRHGHALAVHDDHLYCFGGLSELGAATTALFRAPLPRAALDRAFAAAAAATAATPPSAAQDGGGDGGADSSGADAASPAAAASSSSSSTSLLPLEWTELDAELPFNKARASVLAGGMLRCFQLGPAVLGRSAANGGGGAGGGGGAAAAAATAISDDDVERGLAWWDVYKAAPLGAFRPRQLSPEEAAAAAARSAASGAGPAASSGSGKAARVQHATNTAARLPAAFGGTSAKERALLEYVDGWQRRFRELYPHRRPLPLAPANECGVPKFVATGVRPTLPPLPELYALEGAARFVAEWCVFEPLANPLHPPPAFASPSSTLSWQAGDAFDLANLLASLLLGAGYHALVVMGYAPPSVALGDLSGTECPQLLAMTAAVAEGGGAAAAGSGQALLLSLGGGGGGAAAGTTAAASRASSPTQQQQASGSGGGGANGARHGGGGEASTAALMGVMPSSLSAAGAQQQHQQHQQQPATSSGGDGRATARSHRSSIVASEASSFAGGGGGAGSSVGGGLTARASTLSSSAGGGGDGATTTTGDDGGGVISSNNRTSAGTTSAAPAAAAAAAPRRHKYAARPAPKLASAYLAAIEGRGGAAAIAAAVAAATAAAAAEPAPAATTDAAAASAGDGAAGDAGAAAATAGAGEGDGSDKNHDADAPPPPPQQGGGDGDDAGTQDQPSSLPPPKQQQQQQQSRHVHAWVAVLPGRRGVTEPLFVEPSTGCVLSPAAAPYTGVELVWNAHNAWACMQMPEPHSDSRAAPATLCWDLNNAAAWEPVLTERQSRPPTVDPPPEPPTAAAAGAMAGGGGSGGGGAAGSVMGGGVSRPGGIGGLSSALASRAGLASALNASALTASMAQMATAAAAAGSAAGGGGGRPHTPSMALPRTPTLAMAGAPSAMTLGGAGGGALPRIGSSRRVVNLMPGQQPPGTPGGYDSGGGGGVLPPPSRGGGPASKYARSEYARSEAGDGFGGGSIVGGGGGAGASDSKDADGGVEADAALLPELPPSWVPRLAVTREMLDTRCPRGSRTFRYRRATREVFATFGECARWDGLVERLTRFDDDACRVTAEVIETFARRRDKLLERRTLPQAGTTHERFAPGGAFALRALTTVRGARRVAEFYAAARLDGLVRREELFGARLTECFSGRDDGLERRCATYAPPQQQQLGHHAASGIGGGGINSGGDAALPLPPATATGTGERALPLLKVSERFARSSTGSSGSSSSSSSGSGLSAAIIAGDVAKRTFHLAAGRAAVRLHVAPGRLTASSCVLTTRDTSTTPGGGGGGSKGRAVVSASASAAKDAVDDDDAADGDNEVVLVDPLAPPPTALELREAARALRAAEKAAVAAVRDAEWEGREIAHARAAQERGGLPALEAAYVDAARLRAAAADSDDEPPPASGGGFGADGAPDGYDYLAAFLPTAAAAAAAGAAAAPTATAAANAAATAALAGLPTSAVSAAAAAAAAAAVAGTSTLTREQALVVRERCLAALKERLGERAATIATRLEEERAALAQRQAALAREHDSGGGGGGGGGTPEEEEAAANAAAVALEEAAFRVGVLQRRLQRHEETALAKYRSLERRLRDDPRLSALAEP